MRSSWCPPRRVRSMSKLALPLAIAVVVVVAWGIVVGMIEDHYEGMIREGDKQHGI